MAIKTLEEKELAAIRDFFVKLSKVFSSCYITNTGYIIDASKEQNDDIYRAMCVCTDVYISLFKTRFFNNAQVIKIDSITEIKDDITKFKPVTDNKILDSIFKTIDNNCKYNDESTWIPMNFDESCMNTVFDDNSYINYNLQIQDKSVSILFSKSLIPLISKTNISNRLSYKLIRVSSELGLWIVRFDFTHFTQYTYYGVIL